MLKPKSKYGKSKLSNEIYASELIKSYDISMVGLRFFSVYGPFGRPDMAYYSFTKAIKENRAINLNNEGNMFRDMTFIDDIIQGMLEQLIIFSILRDKNKNEIFNLGNDAPIKTSYLLQKLKKLLVKRH